MQQKQSIVQVIDILNAGGAERVLVTLGNLLHQNDHYVKVITTVKPGTLAAQLNKDIAFKNLHRSWKWNPITMYRLIQAVKPFDIIHVHSRHNLRYLLLAKAFFGLKQKIFYHEHHGYRINTKATALEKKLFSKIIFIAVSDSLRKWAIKKADVEESKAFVLPNIVLKKEVIPFQKSNDVIQLLVVSNFVAVKNIEFAIEVLKQLINQKNKQYHLTIAGAKSDVIYFEKIVQLIKEKRLETYISFIHDCADAQTILPQFHLALHTSFSESGPLVLMEYMAQQLPFITYSTGEVVNQIKEALPECIIENFETIEWVKRINTLLEADVSLLQNKLQTIFNNNYSPDIYYNKCLHIYNAALAL